jgi:hypothetical protein
MMPWEPQTGRSVVNTGNGTFAWRWLDAVGKTSPNREDRKYVTKVPLCERTARLQFTIFDPDLQWLGFSGENISSASLVMSINGKPVRLTNNGVSTFGMTIFQELVHVSDFVSLSPHYNMTFCRKGKTPIGLKYFAAFLRAPRTAKNQSRIGILPSLR